MDTQGAAGVCVLFLLQSASTRLQVVVQTEQETLLRSAYCKCKVLYSHTHTCLLPVHCQVSSRKTQVCLSRII